MEIALDKIIQIITQQVVKELQTKGVKILATNAAANDLVALNSLRTKSEQPDMSAYKTPILTEQHVKKLHELTGEIIVPVAAKITPKAKELIKQKQLIVTRK